MKKNRYISSLLSILLLTLVCLQGKVVAQDIHFSQYMLAPLTMNPANAGLFSGTHRAFLNYKNQWNGMAEKGAAFKTFMCSYDTRLLTDKIKNGYMGAGFNAFRDVAGDLNLGTTQLNMSLSGVVSISETQAFSGGIQAGLVQKSISTTAMKWDSQYNEDLGEFDPTLPSNDVMSIPPRIYADLGGGLVWSYNANKSSNYATNQKKINAGISAFHLNRPNQKFEIYNKDPDALYTKFVLHGSAHYAFGDKGYQVLPSVAFFKQGPTQQLNVGGMFRWVIQAKSRYTGFVQGMAVSAGFQYRSADAINPMALFEYSDFALGVSYDVNISSLKTGTRGRGGLEVAIRYIKPFGASPTRILE